MSKPNNLVQRILSAVVLAPALLGLIIYGRPEWFFLVLLPTSAILLYEWHALRGSVAAWEFVLQVALAWLLLGTRFPGLSVATDLAVELSLLVLMLVALVQYRDHAKVVETVAFRFMGLAYCTLPLVFLQIIRNTGDSFLLLFPFLVVWATDTGAYFSGRRFGQRKLAPRLSPKKTWAGFWGGLFCGGLTGLAMSYSNPLAFAPGMAMLLGLTVSLAGQMGDLAESLLKREAEVKDSGSLIPGHGGFLDRLDSLLFAVPVYYLLLAWIGGPGLSGVIFFAD